MIEKQIPIDQTQFSFEEPIFEDQAVYTEDKPVVPQDDQPKSNKKVFLIAGIVGLVILILLILVVLLKREAPEEVLKQADIKPDQVEEVGPFQARIDDARELLELSDPTKQDLSFPPVDMQIRLDPKLR